MNIEAKTQDEMSSLEDYLSDYLTKKRTEKEKKQEPHEEFLETFVKEYIANGGTRGEALDSLQKIGLFQSWYCKSDYQKVLFIKVLMYMGDNDKHSLNGKSVDEVIEGCGYKDSRDLKDQIDKLPTERVKEIIQFLYFAPSPNHFYYFLCEVVKDELENMHSN